MTDVPPRDPSCWPTPEQLVAEWDQLTHEQRLTIAAQLIENAQLAHHCRTQCHDASHARTAASFLKQDGGLIRLVLPEDDFTEAFTRHALAEPERHPTLVMTEGPEGGR